MSKNCFTDPCGFDYAIVYDVSENALKSKLDNNNYTGKESTIALLIPSGPPSQDQKNFLESKRKIIESSLPGRKSHYRYSE